MALKILKEFDSDFQRHIVVKSLQLLFTRFKHLRTEVEKRRREEEEEEDDTFAQAMLRHLQDRPATPELRPVKLTTQDRPVTPELRPVAIDLTH